MSRLRLRKGYSNFGEPRLYVEDTEPDSLASVGYSIVAATLAEPLRRAFIEHLDACDCERRGGFGYCPAAMQLFRMLPESEQIILG